jgi:hypothetical protein
MKADAIPLSGSSCCYAVAATATDLEMVVETAPACSTAETAAAGLSSSCFFAADAETTITAAANYFRTNVQGDRETGPLSMRYRDLPARVSFFVSFCCCFLISSYTSHDFGGGDFFKHSSSIS